MTNYSISLDKIGLTMPIGSFRFGARGTIKLPIADHPLIVQNTCFGAVATLNILHPGSPAFPELRKTAKIRNLPKDGINQMTALADYIYDMFKKGITLLAVQEMPGPNTQPYKVLINRLRNKPGINSLIDLATFHSQWVARSGRAYGTPIFLNPTVFSPQRDHLGNVLPPKLCLSGNGAVSQLIAIPSGHQVAVANIHGDFNKSAETIDFINQFDGFCLGDTNVRNGDDGESHRIDTKGNFISCEEPIFTVKGIKCCAHTVDIIKDSFSRKFDPSFVPDRTKIKPLKKTQPCHAGFLINLLASSAIFAAGILVCIFGGTLAPFGIAFILGGALLSTLALQRFGLFAGAKQPSAQPRTSLAYAA